MESCPSSALVNILVFTHFLYSVNFVLGSEVDTPTTSRLRAFRIKRTEPSGPASNGTGNQINVVKSAPWLLLCTWSASPMPCNSKNKNGP